MDTHSYPAKEQKSPEGHRSIFSIWGLAFGCVIGWGCFVMPGTTFLPDAGPLGALIGIAAGVVMILIVTMNYSILTKHYPGAAGSFGYAKELLGNDYAFLAAWALVISYLMLLWANATAFILIGRYFIGDVLQRGVHYTVAGYDVYFGEVAVTILIELVFGLLICYAKKAVYYLRITMGTILFGSVIILFFGVLFKEGIRLPHPLFSPDGWKGMQILSVTVLAPWMFVGFETVYDKARKEGFSVWQIIYGAAGAVAAGAVVYTFLALIAGSGMPEGYGDWTEYIGNLGSLGGIDGMPVFFNIRRVLGTGGILLSVLAVFCALSTGVLGFFQAAAGLMKTMAEEELLPASFAEETDGIPRRACFAILLLSLPIPFLGRTSIGWLVDDSTLAVAVVYAQVSVGAYRVSGKQRHAAGMISGLSGAVLSAAAFVFLLIPNIFAQNALTEETYFMMAVWSLTGIIYYWYIFKKDTHHRFGKSIVMWILLLSLLFLSVNLWISLDTLNRAPRLTDEGLFALLTRNSIIEVGLIGVMILLIFSLFSTMLRREKTIDLERVRAEESDRAKSTFLFNMSHDIRTPMNAIIGYTTLALKEKEVPPGIHEYLKKIDTSGHHLLALINDILEMSRIENGKIELETAPVDLKALLSEMKDMFATQMAAKKITFTVDTSGIRDQYALCDKNRFNRILLNLVSNACKFTPEGGRVSVIFSQNGRTAEQAGRYELRVRDNGIGMSREFAEKVFEAFERERTSTANDIEGTGLGMAITKSFVTLMGGTIEVDTAPGEGTEFILHLDFPVSDKAAALSGMEREIHDINPAEADFSNVHLLLAEDNEINREIAAALLTSFGFTLETAENGKEAVDMVAASKPGHFDAVLMDIQMPVMNGYEAARAIRALENPELAAIPIAAMTANAFAEDIEEAAKAGMNGHIAKPIDIEKMMDTLTEILTEKQTRVGQ